MSGKKPEKLSSTLRNATTKPSWGARIHTLNTGDAANYGEVTSANRVGGSSSTKSLSPSLSFAIQNITTLPSNEHAMALLRRVQSEFTSIAQKRGYVISSVTEMCCCADGLDHLPGKKRGRRTRTMPNNVLGYNLTQGTRGGGQRRSVHRIHLRLRHPNRHTFYSYDDIAGVMCHELAHCEVGPHNAQFYKVMDEIMEQHAVFMVRGVVTDQSGFPINSDDAHVLGGGRTGECVGNERRRRHEEIAQNRLRQQKMLGLGGSFRLGGGFLPGDTAAASLAHLPPSEAAKVAAERRIEELRRNDSKYCLPCQEVIEILDASSDEEEEMEGEKDLGRIGTDCPYNVQQAQNSEVIILDDSDSSTSPESTFKVPARSLRSKRKDVIDNVSRNRETCNHDCDLSEVECTSWTCAKCTFDNDPKHLACEVCGYEQNKNHRQSKILKRLRETQIQDLKAKEVEDSIREFGGFNIYGTSKKSSRTLHHIT